MEPERAGPQYPFQKRERGLTVTILACIAAAAALTAVVFAIARVLVGWFVS
jgi:hypothetical protein